MNCIKNSILFINGADYTLGWGRSVNLARAFASMGSSVFYCEHSRPIYKARSSISAGDGFSVLHTSSFPIMKFQFLRGLNTKYQLKQLTGAMDKERFCPDILWVCTVTDLKILKALIERYRPSRVIYDCADDHVAHAAPFVNQTYLEKIRSMERDLLHNVDMVFAVSTKLLDQMALFNDHVSLVPNGVDMDLFTMDSVKAIPVDIERIKEPKVGFVGTLGHWIDLDLVKWVAVTRPDWSFVFVGSTQVDGVNLDGLPGNVYFLGEKDYTDIPAYIAGFDVCIVPFKDCSIAEGSDSLKVLQYMAMGKPVVSSAYKGVKDYGGLVRVAETQSDFLDEIESYLNKDSLKAGVERVRVAQEHSWQARVAEIFRVFKSFDGAESLSNL